MTIDFLKKLPATEGADKGIWNLINGIRVRRCMSGQELTIIAFANSGPHLGQVEDDEGVWHYPGNLDVIT